jgi:hypothetical protein
MRILGDNKAEETYIVEINKDELANLMGFYAGWDNNFREAIENKKNIKVSHLYSDAKKLEELLEKMKSFEALFVDIGDAYFKIKRRREERGSEDGK